MSLKILHIASSFFPEYLGASTRIFNLLSRQPYDIRLFAPDRIKGEEIQKKEEQFFNINVKRIPLDYQNGVFDNIPYLGFMNDMNHKSRILLDYAQKEEFDIVHGHNPLGFGLAAKAIAEKSKKIFVYEAHGLNIDSYNTRITKMNPLFFLGYSYVKKKEGTLLRNADTIITLTQMLKERICEVYNIIDDKIKVIPNGVSMDNFSPKEENNIRIEHIKKESNVSGKVIMYAGYMDKINGVLDIATIIPEIIQESSNVNFVFIGSGPAEEKLLSLSKVYPKNIKFLGNIPYEEMPIYYQLSDVFIIPRPPTMSAETIIPLKLLEAMAMETIVLGSDVGGISNVIKHGYNGYLFKKGDINNLKTTLLKVLESDKTQIAINARKTIVEGYTWDKSAKILRNVYENFL